MTARAKPQNEEVWPQTPWRWVAANSADDLPEYSYEAVWVGNANSPRIEVYTGSTGNPCCNVADPTHKALLGFDDGVAVLYRTLTVYATETDDPWASLADHANQAAYDLFWPSHGCCGICEQRKVSAAFEAMGWPKQEGFITPNPICNQCFCE